MELDRLSQEPDLLQDLLRLLASDQVHTVADLAAQLGVEAGLVMHMLHTLEQAGYLTAVEPQCARACESCPLSGSCGLILGARIWTLTERGRRAASKG